MSVLLYDSLLKFSVRKKVLFFLGCQELFFIRCCRAKLIPPGTEHVVFAAAEQNGIKMTRQIKGFIEINAAVGRIFLASLGKKIHIYCYYDDSRNQK